MQLPVSARLDAILSLLSPCHELADVCTDHGLVPVVAVQRGIAQHAIAADLRAAPLEVARQNISRADVSDRVTLLQGDGLAPLTTHSVDALVIAGVSGELIVRLLAEAPHVTSRLTQLVLQANQDVDVVRAWALTQGLHLHAERMVEERGYFFPICAYRPGEGADAAYAQPGWSERELCMVGPLLLTQRDPTALRAYEQQRTRLGKLVAQGVATHASELAVWSRACAELSP